MITNRDAYERGTEQERWDALRRLSLEETIAITEQLLTSEIMDVAEFPDDDHPLSLARSLGITRETE